MNSLLSSWVTALVFLFAILVGPGACVQPACDYVQSYGVYGDVVANLRFKVTGQADFQSAITDDCEALQGVAPKLQNLTIEGCDSYRKDQLEKLRSGLQLTLESLCDDKLMDHLIQWKHCFDHGAFARCKEDVQHRLNQLEADGALDPGYRVCRNHTDSYQCALQAGDKCPPQAAPARRAVENYVNSLMDVLECPRPADVACEERLFRDCYGISMAKMKIMATGPHPGLSADSLTEDCKVAEAVSTCTRNLRIDKCPEEVKARLRTLRDGFASTRNSLCDQKLGASISEWNGCFDKQAFDSCLPKMERPPPVLSNDTTMPPVLPFCSLEGERLKCELAAGRNCPKTAHPARTALRNLGLTRLDFNGCPRPNIDSRDGGGGSSTTPKMLVTLGALFVALIPMKQALLRHLR